MQKSEKPGRNLIAGSNPHAVVYGKTAGYVLGLVESLPAPTNLSVTAMGPMSPPADTGQAGNTRRQVAHGSEIVKVVPLPSTESHAMVPA